jgi:phage terminase small subunit
MTTFSDPDNLTTAQRAFCLTYLANGFNASAAYKSAHPGVTDGTARTEGHRTLAIPNIKAFLDKRLAHRWKALQMDGDEVLGRIALDARADIRLAYDANGNMLPVSEWPDDLANSVVAVQQTVQGMKIVLTNKLAARRIIAEVTKRLKGPGGGTRTLARILAGDYEEDADE